MNMFGVFSCGDLFALKIWYFTYDNSIPRFKYMKKKDYSVVEIYRYADFIATCMQAYSVVDPYQ